MTRRERVLPALREVRFMVLFVSDIVLFHFQITKISPFGATRNEKNYFISHREETIFLRSIVVILGKNYINISTKNDALLAPDRISSRCRIK